jgi:hypothetical protein
VSFAAPPGTSLTGNSAEWIVEAPSLSNNDIAALTNYVQDFFAETWATSFGDILSAPGAPGAATAIAVTMTDAADNPISTVKAIGGAALQFNTAGSAE